MQARAAVIVALAAALTGCGSSGTSISAGNPRALVLQRSDLSNAFSSFYSGPQAQIDETPHRRDLSRFDRKGGWITRFHRAGSTATPGPLVVASRVDVFKNASGAKDDFGAYTADLEQTPLTTVSVPKIGDQTLAVASRLGAGATSSVTYTIAWRRANATASVDVNGFARRLKIGDAVALARKQDLRLRAADR